MSLSKVIVKAWFFFSKQYVKYHFICEVIIKKKIFLRKIDTAHEPTEMLMKSLTLATFEHYLNLVNLHRPSA